MVIKRFLPLIILIGLIATAYTFNLHHYLSLEQIQSQKDIFQNYVSENPIISILIFMGAYTVSVALSLPIASLLTLLGGFLFGLVAGTLMVVTSATLGATIVFLIAKTSLGQTLRDKAGSLYKKVEKNMNENAFGYLLFMRLVPLFPFVLVNIVPALFNISLRTFLITTFIGILPGSAVYVFFGQQLGSIQSLGDIVSPNMLIAFGLLGLFALIPTLYTKWKKKND